MPNPATLIGILLGSAVAFAIAYRPVFTHLSKGLVSSYTKADLRKRFSAALIDGFVAIVLWYWYWTTGSAPYAALGAGYLLMRDAIGGQSVGKLFVGLVVIDLTTGRAASIFSSFNRNLVLLLPGANVAAIFLEARTIIVDPQGQRLGDRIAQTQVVEGAGAKDLVKSFQEWLLTLGRGVGHSVGGRRRVVPDRIDRAA